MQNRAENIYVTHGDTSDSEPDPSTSVKAIAEREGKSLQEVFYEVLTSGDGRCILYLPALNFKDRKLDEQHAILSLPNTVFSFGDAGAHVAQVSDAAYSSISLAHWGRDRANGIPLERLVHQMSGAQANLFGFKDRGRIGLGTIADINVIDHKALTVKSPEMLFDLPGGGRRLIQRAVGYIATIVRGVGLVEHDEMTGQLPGQVLRSR
jgi:N-acyl-D-aspartate/D-glutamate deacylase